MDEDKEGVVVVKNAFNVCDPQHFDHASIQDLIASITTPILVTTKLETSDKTIHLRDDHGKDKLEAFGKRLLNSEYVVSIINSLPFNPKATGLIRKSHADGKIELVLYWEDKGIGLVIQTTGRNIHETNAIAEILKDKYDH